MYRGIVTQGGGLSRFSAIVPSVFIRFYRGDCSGHVREAAIEREFGFSIDFFLRQCNRRVHKSSDLS